jgi:SAM-dependent methyltransferase
MRLDVLCQLSEKWNMGRFETTVPYYRRFRTPYPPAFFSGLAGLLGLDGSQALVDLGCGPAMLAIGFAPHVRSVTGVDPEPAMIAAAREAAAEAGVPLTLHECRTEDLPSGVGPFAVATIGRALHWMEPKATIASLDRLLGPGGAIAVCTSRSAEDGNPWLEAYDSLRDRLVSTRDHDHYRKRHEDFFNGSLFSRRDSLFARTEQTITLADLSGRLLSLSIASPAALGARAGGISNEVEEALTAFLGADGTLKEIVEAKAVIFGRKE